MFGSAEFIPLRFIPTLESIRLCAKTRSFQLNETAECLADFDTDVRSPAKVIHLRLSFRENTLGNSGEKSLRGAFELILRLCGHPTGEVRFEFVGELVRGGAELGWEICKQSHAAGRSVSKGETMSAHRASEADWNARRYALGRGIRAILPAYGAAAHVVTPEFWAYG